MRSMAFELSPLPVGDTRVTLSARLVNNSKWNLMAFMVTLASNFLTIPFVVRHISLSSFGAAGLVIAALAPFVVVGTVLGQATLREVANRYAKDDIDRCNQTCYAALSLCAVGCAAVAVGCLAFGEQAVRFFAGSDTGVVDWKLGLLIALVGWTAQQFTLVLQAAVAATQQYASLATIGTAASVVNAIAIVGTVAVVPSAVGYLAGISLGYVASLVVWSWLVRRKIPWLFPLRTATGSEFRSLIDFSKWQGLSHFFGAIGLQMDRYALGLLASLTVVGQYNVAMRLQEVVHMAVLKATEVLFPHFSATSNDPVEQRAAFFAVASWVLNIAAVFALVPLIPLSWAILALWVGTDTANGAAPMLRTLAIAGIFGAGTNVYAYQAMGTGQSRMLARISVVHSMVTAALTLLLIRNFGALAAGGGLLATNALRLAWVAWLAKKSFRPALALQTLLVCCVGPLMAGLMLAWAWYVVGKLEPSNWLGLAMNYALVGVTAVAAAVLATSLSATGRAVISQTARTTRALISRRH